VWFPVKECEVVVIKRVRWKKDVKKQPKDLVD